MNKIDQLLKKYCPEGVEEKPLFEILQYEQPTKYIVKSTKYDNSYLIPVLTPGKTFILGYTNEHTNIYLASKQNPVIIFDDFTTSFHWIDFNFKIKSSAVKILKPIFNISINFRYVYYAMKKINYVLSISSHKRQWIQTYSNFRISVPPIEIQNKIVEILDNFSELEAELEAELEFRNIQYEHYNNKLLDFDNNQSLLRKLISDDFLNKEVKTYKLTEVAKISNGDRITKSELLENGEFTVYNGSISIFGTCNKWNTNKYASIVVRYGSAGLVGFLKNVAWVGDASFIVETNDLSILNPQYLYYFLKNSENYFVKSKILGSTPSLSKSVLEDFEIKVPSIEIQNKIVRVLEKLETYNKDVNTGLPAEVNARKSQYDYYLNKLLTFKTGGAIGNDQLECIKFLENIFLYIVEYKKLWEIVDFDKRFKDVDKEKQTNVLKFKHISASLLKKYSIVSNCKEVKLLSTGYFGGYTKYNKNDININQGEIISIPSGGEAILKYHNGYFIDSLNILFSSKNIKLWNLKFIYYFLVQQINYIKECFVGSSIKHSNMKKIINIKIPIPHIDI